MAFFIEEPQRGDSSFCRRFAALKETGAITSQGLTPLAIDCRPFGTQAFQFPGNHLRPPSQFKVSATDH